MCLSYKPRTENSTLTFIDCWFVIDADDQNDEDTENYIPRSWFDDVQR